MAAEIKVGAQVGRHRLLFRLGKGGMGEVWAAQYGSDGIHKTVALKLVRTPNLDSQTGVLFLDEARAAAALQHPAIVQTFDLGRDGDLTYIAMELVRGPSLTALLQRVALLEERLDPAIVAMVGERIASALDYAYARAVSFDGRPLELIHRDVSPQNILFDLEGGVHLTDFGVARTAVQDHLSVAGSHCGKPSYMSPEQVRAEPLDARSDVFSLGIVLYEASTTKRLFGRKDPKQAMEAVLTVEPEPIPELAPGFPPELWAVIAKALQKDRKDRQASAGQLARELTEAMRALPGSVGVGRALAARIGTAFLPDAFELDARVREAENQIDPTPRVATAPPATIDARARGPSAAWPSVHGAEIDPLGPDALAEAVKVIELETPVTPLPAAPEGTYSLSRLWKRPGIPGRETAPDPAEKPPATPLAKPLAETKPMRPAVMGPPIGTPTPLAPPTGVGLEVQLMPARPPLPPAIVLGGFALILAVGVGGIVIAYRTFGGPEQDGLTAPAELQALPGRRQVAIEARPGAIAAPPAPAPTGSSEAQAAPERHPRPPPRERRPERSADPPPAPPPPPKPAAPSSPDEIWQAIGRLERSDPAAAARMRATFVEANSDGPKLRALGEEVRRALSGSH